jgi:hypothetical protein
MQRMLSRASSTGLLLVAAAVAGGCFVARTGVNEPLSRTKIDELVPGRSTATEVTELLGAPGEVVQLGRRSAYRYDFTQTKSAALILIVVSFVNHDTRADRVWLFFDENDVLTHSGATLQAADARYAMPWWDVHER